MNDDSARDDSRADAGRSDDDMVDDKTSGAYALGALTPADAAEFEQRLAHSEELRAEVAGFTDTAALLAEVAPAIAPPARVKSSLMAMLDSAPQLAPVPREDQVEEPRPQAQPVVAATETAPPVVAGLQQTAPDATRSHNAGRRRRRAMQRRFGVVLASAAAAIVLFVGGVAVGNVVGGDSQSGEFAALSAAEDVQRTSIELPSGGSASLVASSELGRSAIVFNDADPLPDDEIYQAWFVRDGGPVSAGLLTADGSGQYYRVLDGSYSDGDVVAITREPDGGSEQPTTDPIVFAAGDASSTA